MRASTMFVPANYFKTLGVALARGAGFDASADDPLSAEPVVILGYRFWQNRLGADPDIVGKTLTMDGIPHVVVGVAPDQFGGHIGFHGLGPLCSARTASAPARPHRRRRRRERSRRSRRRSGCAFTAGCRLASAFSRRAQRLPRSRRSWPGRIRRPTSSRPGSPRRTTRSGRSSRSNIWRIQAVGVHAHRHGAAGRVPEYLRHDAGAWRDARARAVHPPGDRRQPGTAGSISACPKRSCWRVRAERSPRWCSSTCPSLVSWLTGNPIPAQLQEALRVNLSMVAIIFGICLLTSLVFGWLPALRFSRPVIISSLKDDAGGGGLRVGRVHRVTAALQVAIAVPLLVMSGQSLDRVRATATAPLGFDADRLYAAAAQARRSHDRERRLPDPAAQRHARAGQRCGVRHRGGWPATRLPVPHARGSRFRSTPTSRRGPSPCT